MTTLNFIPVHAFDNEDAEQHFDWLTKISIMSEPIDSINKHGVPEGYEGYHSIDIVGPELKWMNDTFSKDKFVWYHWFESVFLVPDEMLVFLKLRWL